MDLIDRLRELSLRIPKLTENGSVTTEEGAKNALVMPFITALGYDVFNPLEVTPELHADIGTKKGEKVDYAILHNGKPIMIVECKGFGVDLHHVHASQLYRYFSVVEARFSILTNGIAYHFFSDLDAPNRMDAKPFFIFDLNDFNEQQVESLKQFSKGAFDQDKILTTASQLKYKNAIKQFLSEQLAEPGEDFVRLCLRDAYTKRFTQNAVEEFTRITKDAMRSFISDQVEKRLKSALASEEETNREVAAETDDIELASESDSIPENEIVTTPEEMNGYYAVKSIVREVVDARRITIRDAKSYCVINLDDNNRRPICRLHFNRSQKYVGMFDGDRNEERIPIETVDDIYGVSEKLVSRVKHLVEQYPEP